MNYSATIDLRIDGVSHYGVAIKESDSLLDMMDWITKSVAHYKSMVEYSPEYQSATIGYNFGNGAQYIDITKCDSATSNVTISES